MENIQKIALEKILKSLTSLGCQFAVVDPDGVKHGDLEIVQPRDKSKRRANKYPYGEIQQYANQKLIGIAAGAVVAVPKDKYELEDVQAACGHFMRRSHGSDSYMTTQVRDKNVVEVLRLL